MSKGLIPPKYALVDGTEMRLVGNRYYRDAGRWDIGYANKENVFVTKGIVGVPRLRGLPITQITRTQYAKGNKGYLPKEY